MAMNYCKMRAENTVYYLAGTDSSDESDIALPKWFVSAVHRNGSGSWGISDACAWQGREHERAFIQLARGWEPGGQFSMARNHAHSARVALHDFTFAPSKSVTVAWALADEETARLIELAQERAVRWALSILAQSVVCRLGRGGIDKQPAEIVGTLFMHGTSRSLDPHLHTHSVLFNMTPRSAESCAALELRRVMVNSGVVACHYNAELAMQLREIGFEVESTKEGGSFELAHVSAHVCDTFSSRRAVIENMVRRSSTGDALVQHRARTHRARYQRAVWTTRTDKRHVPLITLRQLWRERAELGGYDAAELYRLQRLKRGVAADLPFSCLYEQAKKWLLSKMDARAWMEGSEAEVEVLKSLTGWCNAAKARQVFFTLKDELLSRTEAEDSVAWWRPFRYKFTNKCAILEQSDHRERLLPREQFDSPKEG